MLEIYTVSPDFLRPMSDQLEAGQYVLYSEYLRLQEKMAQLEAALTGYSDLILANEKLKEECARVKMDMYF